MRNARSWPALEWKPRRRALLTARYHVLEYQYLMPLLAVSAAQVTGPQEGERRISTHDLAVTLDR